MSATDVANRKIDAFLAGTPTRADVEAILARADRASLLRSTADSAHDRYTRSLIAGVGCAESMRLADQWQDAMLKAIQASERSRAEIGDALLALTEVRA